jgi:hypothetical protein
VRVSADNDAFNFWIPPWARTDHEYTSGVHGALEFDGPLGWRLWPGPSREAAHRTTHAFGLGQAIYTGEPAADVNGYVDPHRPLADQSRPNAGWLYLEAVERDSSERRTNEWSLNVGVVGPQALGERMQQFFHSLGPEYQRPPDWRRQLPFEPGFVARFTRTGRPLMSGGGGRMRAALLTEVGGAVGTIVTEATVGGGASADIILFGTSGAGSPLRLLLAANARARVVLRDEFLDGTIFRTSESVPKEPFVTEQRGTITVRWGPFDVTYRANRASRQYRNQPKPSSWGTIEAEWRVTPPGTR